MEDRFSLLVICTANKLGDCYLEKWEIEKKIQLLNYHKHIDQFRYIGYMLADTLKVAQRTTGFHGSQFGYHNKTTGNQQRNVTKSDVISRFIVANCSGAFQ